MKSKRLSIRFLILTLLVFAMIGTFVGSVISSVIVSKNNLEKNYLIENQFYAKKLADTTDSLFKNMLKTLTIEAQDKEYVITDSKAIQLELERLLESTTFFNSLLFVDQTGFILATTTKEPLKNKQLNTVGAKEALEKKVPLISKPYLGVTGNLILLVSAPVFDDNGVYKGFLAGTIQLHEDNSLKKVLGQHPIHQNDSYVYVVDPYGNIIYHPDKTRINDNAKDNKVVQEVLKGKNGNKEVVNTKGIPLLAGYASSDSKWGIISQTPKKSVIEPTIEMAKQVSLITIAFMIFVFILSLIIVKKIVTPIRKLAIYAKQITIDPTVTKPRIPDWYFELNGLKLAILVAVEFYEKKLTYAESESNLDPLTGYYNRRSLEQKLNTLDRYSIILFDIDHFKSVNDEFGHQVGDEVLKYLSRLVKKETRENDLCFRIGGEEFMIVLPDTDIEMSKTIAERIRKTIEDTISPTGKLITISIGIGHFPNTANNFTDLFSVVDKALYKAKQEGRNRVVTANVNCINE
ncbi:sensor domain-containing diguanylate cyclase [Peribacillus asahii]|uniref:sensor domain-containing diguanylate cyclase n=1 Tax=Peribacillus asahii TaxID=228899 RepID=UPI00382D0AB3